MLLFSINPAFDLLPASEDINTYFAPDYEEQMRDIFELLLAKAAAAFRRLPCVEDADLLENILYSGIWLKYNVKNARRRPRGG